MGRYRRKNNSWGLLVVGVAIVVTLAQHDFSAGLTDFASSLEGAWAKYGLIGIGLAVFAVLLYLLLRPSPTPRNSAKASGLSVGEMQAHRPQSKPISQRQFSSVPVSAPVPQHVIRHTGPHLSLQTIRDMEWFSFELLCQKYFQITGLRADKTGAGPDGGVDIVLYKSDGSSPYALVQCKTRTVEHVGVSVVRELLGVMSIRKIAEGIVLCNGTFSKEALALEGSCQNVMLIDAHRLWNMICALTDEQRSQIERMLAGMDYYTPTCPNCEIKLVRRLHADQSEFWGCPNYRQRERQCRYKAPVSRAYKQREAAMASGYREKPKY